MKRTIVKILLFSFIFIPISPAFAQEQGNPEDMPEDFQTLSTNSIYLRTNPAIPVPMSINTITIEKEQGVDIDLDTAYIIWYIDRMQKSSGVGLSSYDLKLDTPSNPILIGARVQYRENGILKHLDTFIEIKPGFGPEIPDSDEKLTTAQKEDNNILISTSPAKPRLYQKTTFHVVSKDPGCNAKEQPILWKLNGKAIGAETIGMTEFTTRLVSDAINTEVSAQVGSCGENTLSFLPKSEYLRLSATQPSRFLNCQSQYVRAVDSRIKVLENEAERLEEKSSEAVEKISQDVAFLTGTITSIGTDWAEMIEAYGDAFSTIGAADLASIAKGIKKLADITVSNPFARRIAYINKRIRYYNNLIRWYENAPARYQAEIDSLKNQILGGQKRCMEILDEKIKNPFEKVDTDINIRKYEW